MTVLSNKSPERNARWTLLFIRFGFLFHKVVGRAWLGLVAAEWARFEFGFGFHFLDFMSLMPNHASDYFASHLWNYRVS